MKTTATSSSDNKRVALIATVNSLHQQLAMLSAAGIGRQIVAAVVPQVGEGVTEQPRASDQLPELAAIASLDELDHVLTRTDLAINHVLISLPLAMADRIRVMTAKLDRQRITWAYLPTLADQLAGRVGHELRLARHGESDDDHAPDNNNASWSTGDSLDLQGLIDRQPRPLDRRALLDCFASRVVMITGSGGSIGSELARIVGRFKPKRLLLVERSENALFEIDRQIARLFPKLPRQAILHDVTWYDRTQDLIDQTRPDIILHAAAHKHVPMMESHPAAAIENNFYGTRSIADAANRFHVRRFVMISTDKAVNPSSVMGASKRLAELYIQHLDRQSTTIYAMVRFGNVLGSACSVLPIWSEQLSRGGPITVTHPEMSRYFMTIPEAAGLVLQAGALARGGEVFLLDMGQPVRIVDLARRFLLQQGFEPDADIMIQFTGIRPGEKLHEVLAYEGEDMVPTSHESIHIWRTARSDPGRMKQIASQFDRLRDRAGDGRRVWRDAKPQAILAALRSNLPEMVVPASGSAAVAS